MNFVRRIVNSKVESNNSRVGPQETNDQSLNQLKSSFADFKVKINNFSECDELLYDIIPLFYKVIPYFNDILIMNICNKTSLNIRFPQIRYFVPLPARNYASDFPTFSSSVITHHP